MIQSEPTQGLRFALLQVMKIGILGAGNIGGILGRYLANAGHDVAFSYVRSDAKLDRLIESIGKKTRRTTLEDLKDFADVIFLAIPWWTVESALNELGALDDKILVDCTNPFNHDLTDLDIGENEIGAKKVAHWAPGAKIVKAFNTLFYQVLGASGGKLSTSSPVVFYCGDNTQANEIVESLIRDCGFNPIFTGQLSEARFQEPRGPLFNRALTLDEAEKQIHLLGLGHETSPRHAA